MNPLLLILAVDKPLEKTILETFRIETECVIPYIEKFPNSTGDISKICLERAEKKALKVSKRSPHAIIVGVDSQILIDGKKIENHENEIEAFNQLQELSGKTLSYLSCFAIIDGSRNKYISDTKTTNYTLRDFDDKEIRRIIEENQGKIDTIFNPVEQAFKTYIFEETNGDPYHYLGIPLATIIKTLREEFNLPIV